MLRVHRNTFSVNIVAGNNKTHLNNTHKKHTCIPMATTAILVITKKSSPQNLAL